MSGNRSLRCQPHPIGEAMHGEILLADRPHIVYVPVDCRMPEPPPAVCVENRTYESPRRGPGNTSIVLMMIFFFALGAMFGSIMESRSAKKAAQTPPEPAAVADQWRWR